MTEAEKIMVLALGLGFMPERLCNVSGEEIKRLIRSWYKTPAGESEG